MRKIYLSFFIFHLSFSVALAQEKVNMVSIGYASQLDTYLSPEHYGGLELRFIGERTKFHKDTLLSHTWTHQGMFSGTRPRSKDGTDLSLMYQLNFGMHWHFRFWEKLDVAVGGQAEFFIGGTYNTRNGNNPAQLRLGLDIAPSVRATYGFRLFRKNLRLRYVVSAPLLGIQFSPAYGQSYYEIFSKGHYDHNCCFAWPGNAPSISNLLTVDIPIGKKALRIGYLGDFRQSKFNDIKFHDYTHGFIIGYAF